jgi:hypothetical protein
MGIWLTMELRRARTDRVPETKKPIRRPENRRTAPAFIGRHLR